MKLGVGKLSRGKADGATTGVVEDDTSAAGKGRPTPKRRDTIGPRGPVVAPKTRKEAYRRQKEMSKRQRTTPSAVAASKLTPAQRREMMRRGDPTVLPARDKGPTRELARDYVDSHRMASNYLLLLFPLILLGYVVALLQILALVLFVGVLVEWFLIGRRIRAMAIERNGEAQGGPMSIGFYAGSRAYLPRRWRLPGPRVQLGDDI